MTGTEPESEVRERAAAVAAYRRQRCAECDSDSVYETDGIDVGANRTWLYGCLACGWRYFLMQKWLRLEAVA